MNAVTFSVDNWYTMTDELQPPLQTGFFGTLDRSKTTSQSDGWEYATDRSQDYFRDGDRLAVSGSGEQYLVWEAPRLHSFRVVMYSGQPPTGDEVVLDLSVDGHDWMPTDYKMTTEGPSTGGVYRMELSGEVDLEAQWFRVRVPEAGDSDSEGSLQVGLVVLRGMN